MGDILPSIDVLIEKTIRELSEKSFPKDPLGLGKYSAITSIISSAYKRHGFILEQTILEQMKSCPWLEVWEDKEFHVGDAADQLVGAIDTHQIPEAWKHTVGADLPDIEGKRKLQVDLIVFDSRTDEIASYEVKRGNGYHDAGKRRSMLRDLLCQEVQLIEYAKTRGLAARNRKVRIIFYYGKRSLPEPYSLTKEDLDEHFGWPIVEAVDEVNYLFKLRLEEMLNNL